MKNHKITKWLWLEDELSSVQDIAANLPSNKKTFNSIGELLNYLIEKKIEKNLLEYGLILDVLIKGNDFLFSPSQWNKSSNDKYIKTEEGRDAGIKFYEELIMNKSNGWKPFWTPPPPVIFLTVMPFDDKILKRLQEIKMAWGSFYNVNPDKARVKWIRKWDVEYEDSEFYKLLKEWGK